jgi:ribosomal protein S18 acetylase RimI-like enzyme
MKSQVWQAALVLGVSSEIVRAAHGDAWQVLGVLDTAELPGVRLMATGLPHPQWNNGDVDDPADVDIAAVRRWYDDRGVPWGMRLPEAAPWPHGRKLFTKRLMGLGSDAFVPTSRPPGVVVREATSADFDDLVHIDATAFEESPALQRPWLDLVMRHPAVTVAVAELDGTPVGCGEVTRSDGRAGPAGYVAGIAVLPEARRRGIAAAITSWLVAKTRDDGAEIWHLHPDTDEAARIYQRLGFVEVDGFDVYIDN